MERVDVAVVGAGVVGLAVAAKLARPDNAVVVLESNPRYGMETSSRNSEVIHGGLYYPPDSLKSKLCHRGRRAIYELAKKGKLFAEKLGKLVVATSPEEIPALEKLKSRAEDAGAENLQILDGPPVLRMLPGLKASAAILSPESGIVDSEELMGYFYRSALDGGAIILFQSPVTNVLAKPGAYQLSFGGKSERLQARIVVNAAGLHSDRLAAMAGIDPDAAGYRLHWCKGSYFRHKSLRARHLIYPLPGKVGLGIHITPDRAGGVRLGPDAEFVPKLDYHVDEAKREAFARSVRAYLPGLKSEDITPDTAGVRPKLSGPEGGFKDFVIAEESRRGLTGWINLIGIDSPGLTASPAIAEMVAGMVSI